MGCGSSKKEDAPPERRIRVTEGKTPQQSIPVATPGPTAPPSRPTSETVMIGKSVQDARMAENENFVKSLPSESAKLLRETMANMVDLSVTDTEPVDDEEKQRLYQHLKDDISLGVTSASPTIPVAHSFDQPEIRIHDEDIVVGQLMQKLVDGFRSIKVTQTQPVVQRFVPFPGNNAQ